MEEKQSYPCPCCGYLVFSDFGTYEICPVCGWEEDESQLRFPTMAGANKPLIDAQKDVTLSDARTKYARDPEWRPLDLNVDKIEVPEEGKDYGQTYPDDRTELYYWRKKSEPNI